MECGSIITKTSLDIISTPYGFLNFCRALKSPEPSANRWNANLYSYLIKVNTKNELKNNSTHFIPTNIDELEQELIDVHLGKIDFLLLDSELNLREQEYYHFAPYLKQNAFVLFHDASQMHKIVREGINRLITQNELQGFIIPSPRGLAVLQYQGSHETIEDALNRLENRLAKADISFDALIAAFEDMDNPVSPLEIEILNTNIAKAKEEGNDLLANTLSNLIEIALRNRKHRKSPNFSQDLV